jgi:carbonic anhydrase
MNIEIDYCGTGQQQSPIEIKSNSTAICRNKCNLLFYYRGSRCNIVRNNRNLYLLYDNGSYVSYNGKRFELERISFSNPGSHIIDGKSGNLECFLFHRAPDTGNLLIVSVILEINEASSPSKGFFDNWTHFIPTTDNAEATNNMSSEWNIFNVLPATKGFYVYNGSIIQPPCTEGATWVVLSTMTNISQSSYAKIIAVIGTNSRKAQPINKRTVQFNPNTQDKNNKNQSSAILCLTDKEIEERCAKIYKPGSANEKPSIFGNCKLLVAIIIILVFIFILTAVVLYKMGVFDKLANKIKPMANSSFELKGIGQN